MARPKNTDERRGQILEALLTVMAKGGYAGATMAAIATEASLTRGLLHYHFRSKREMLVALVEELAHRIESRIERQLTQTPGDPRARLYARLDAQLARGDGADPRAVSAWVAIAAEAVRDEEVRAVYTSAIQSSARDWTDLVRAALREDDRATRDAARIAATVQSAIEGAYLLSAAAPGTLPLGFAAPMIRATLDALLEREAHR
jgi:TetR/AcrR family transcriptional repressor of bet genes